MAEGSEDPYVAVSVAVGEEEYLYSLIVARLPWKVDPKEIIVKELGAVIKELEVDMRAHVFSVLTDGDSAAPEAVKLVLVRHSVSRVRLCPELSDWSVYRYDGRRNAPYCATSAQLRTGWSCWRKTCAAG